jgi:GT2 family glycosyltransferase
MPHTTIGFIIYNDYTVKYLSDFLASLKYQSCKDYKILVFNNGDEFGKNFKLIKDYFPEAEIIGDGENIGFGRAYNKLIRKAREKEVEYFFITNPDVVYNPDVLEKLVKKLENNKELGAVCPKLLRWDFVKRKKTDFIDTFGLNFRNGLMFYDVGQGKKDNLSPEEREIIAPGGASGLWRMEILEKIKEGENYFDSRMFMYKEDCDLAYRFFLSGGKAICASEAIGWHDRTAAIKGRGDLAVIRARKTKSGNVRRWSLVNQEILFRKYWHLQSWRSKIAIIIYRLKVFIWIILFERFLLKDYLTIRKIKSNL